VGELVLRHDMLEAHVQVLHHHDGHVVREPERRRCIYEAHVQVPHHHDGHVVGVHQNRHDEHDLVLRHHDEHDLVLHHRVERVVRELVLRRCTCVVRELDDLLRIDHGIRVCLMAFRHPYVVVCQKGSKHHYCACCHGLRRVVILLYYEHLGREVRAGHGIQPLPPWTLAWHASWRPFVLPQHDEVNPLLAWIQYRGRDLARAFGRAAFS
jgi:hypothetical protein